MKVLFVCSGNSRGDISPIVKNQGESLIKEGIDVQFFPIKGKGITGYFKHTKFLRKFLQNNSIDLIHAHYTLSGWTCILAFPKQPVILSLMGTDSYGEYIEPGRIEWKSSFLIILTYIIQPFVKKIICKSKNIQQVVYLKRKSIIIPNGIEIEKTYISRNKLKYDLELDQSKINILFLGDKMNVRKNFRLLEKAVKLLYDDNIEVISPYPINHNMVIEYLLQVDLLVVSSLMEGSPNVVKEAMACNCPIVSTDVGDVRWLLKDIDGCYLTDFDPLDVANKIKEAIRFSKEHGRTRGREKLHALKLDSGSVANRIIEVYKNVIEKR